MTQVKFKPLAWTFQPDGMVTGVSWGKTYIIDNRAKRSTVIKGLPFSPDFDTLESAKAAAEFDYEQRMLALLEP